MEVIVLFFALIMSVCECYVQFAVEYGVKFMETSAKANVNVEDAFTMLARDIKVKMDKKLVC